MTTQAQASSISLSPSQQIALDMIGHWWEHRERPFFILNGFAGTGKTTLAEYFKQFVSGTVLHAAFTGKAASVMRKKGMFNAQTVHSLVYTLIPYDPEAYRKLKNEREECLANGDTSRASTLLKQMKDLARPEFVLNDESPLRDAKLLIIDEGSMINVEMAKDLLSFEVPIIFLGDPGQLPPIDGQGYFYNQKADITLTEIHRQAQDNPIIRLSMLARGGSKIPKGEMQNPDPSLPPCYVGRFPELPERMEAADQVLTGKNATRLNLNRGWRLAHGKMEPWPDPDERVICLRNTKVRLPNEEEDDQPDRILQIYNGEMFKVLQNQPTAFSQKLLLEAENGEQFPAEATNAYFQEYTQPGIVKSMTQIDLAQFTQFDYAYAITVHKSQGSQWQNVLFYDDGLFQGWKDEDRKKLVYTAITRASDSICILEKN